METYTIEHLTFAYPKSIRPTLNDLNLKIEEGQFITLCGPSGCGKSTFLRQLKTVLTPHGKRKGTILYQGTPLQEVEARRQASEIGFVLQSPENQIVTDKVWHELAFGLESLGYDTVTIRRRVAEMASFFGIESWFHKKIVDLSGGQKQLLNLAAIMVMQPKVLILDEPTSQLDPITGADFLETIGKINRDLGITIIMSEHRLEEVLPLSHRLIVMDEGEIIGDGEPRQVAIGLQDKRHSMWQAMPVPFQIYSHVRSKLPCPLTVGEGRSWLNDFAKEKSLLPIEVPPSKEGENKQAVIELKEVWFRYEKEEPDILKGLSMTIYQGEFYVLLGGNGTGKTTTLSLIAGINKPYRGNVSSFFNPLIGMLPQNPKALFLKKTVRAELEEHAQDKVQQLIAFCHLEHLLERHPYDLSGGEQQRVALAKVLLLEPQILLLDEPTKGLDAQLKEELAVLIKKLQAGGTTLVVVSHDIEFCAKYADRCGLFFDGSLVTQGDSHTFFGGNNFYTTAANRMARHLLPEAITSEEVIKSCGGDTIAFSWEKRDKKEKQLPLQEPITYNETEKGQTNGSYKLSLRTKMAMAMILLVIPLTLFFSIYYLNDRKYYFISLLILIEIGIPFVMVFENRKPQARELVVIAVLCGIGVAGRTAFFMIPQFKPVVALTILSGVCLGPETGFLVGALTGFASNFFFGQGPWTPWQMFSFGIIGFLAGVCFKKGLLPKNRTPLSLFGAITTFFIYGGLMNPASVLMFQPYPTKEMFVLAYIQGIPFDLIHAFATSFFLFFFGQPMMEQLERIKVKYGLIQI